MKYAITAATGKFGKIAIDTLAQNVPVSDIIALARNTQKAAEMLPDGIEIRQGDYTNFNQLTASLAGVDRLLFISSVPGGEMPRIEQHLNVVKAAKAAGVQYIAYTSFPHADTSKMPLGEDHKATEKAIIETDIAHSFLRNNWYLENEMGAIGPVMAGQPFMMPSETGRIGWALERAYAQAAAKVLAAAQTNDVYEFTGPTNSYPELAAALKNVTGKDFPVILLTDEMLNSGQMDPGMVGFMKMLQGLIASGELDETSSDLEDVLGYTLPTLEESLAEILQSK